MNEDLKGKIKSEETAVQRVDPKFAVIRSLVEQSKSKLAEVLPRSMSVERMVKVALGVIAKNPLLLECTPQSVLLSLLTAGEAGLDVGMGKEAYLIPMWNGKINRYECQLWESYVGKIKRMQNSGSIEGIPRARVVHEKDEFEILQGTEERIKHVPYYKGDPGAPVLVYAVMTLKGGQILFEVMRWDEVLAIKARAKKRMKDASSPWDTDVEEMARKTILHRISKPVPKASERIVETEDGSITLAGDQYEIVEETGEIVNLEPKPRRPGRPKGSPNKPKPAPSEENQDAEPPPEREVEAEIHDQRDPDYQAEMAKAKERIAARQRELGLTQEA